MIFRTKRPIHGHKTELCIKNSIMFGRFQREEKLSTISMKESSLLKIYRYVLQTNS